jgi:hypothetical protein
VPDLGDPLRFHHMLRAFKLTSPKSLGTWCLTAYSLPLAAAAALGLWPAGGSALEWVRKFAVALGLLPALGPAVYKAVLLSTNAQRGWRDALGHDPHAGRCLTETMSDGLEARRAEGTEARGLAARSAIVLNAAAMRNQADSGPGFGTATALFGNPETVLVALELPEKQLSPVTESGGP